MICQISGQPISPTLITYRELGFGQPVELPVQDYQIAYDRTEFINLLKADYKELLEDQKTDDEATADPYPKYLRELGYPTLEVLLDHPDYLEDMVTWFLWDELLALTFAAKPGGETTWKWVINSIDKVEVRNGTVCITGKVFERQPVRV